MPGSLVPIVEPAAVLSVEPLHPSAEVRLWRLDQEMHVVVHQAVGQTAPSRSSASPSEQVEVDPPIAVVSIDHLLVVAARVDVVDPARDFLSWFARHAGPRHAG